MGCGCNGTAGSSDPTERSVFEVDYADDRPPAQFGSFSVAQRERNENPGATLQAVVVTTTE